MYVLLGIAGIVLIGVIVGVYYLFFRPDAPAPDFAPGQTALDFTVKDIAGRDVDLRRYRGHVVMIVNVASKCGFTPQYEQLNEVYKTYREQGFAVLGFPANNFMGQEPGGNEEIQAFCKKNYGVEFDLFSKVSVRGSDIVPLYSFLTNSPGSAGPIQWNFTKFLLNREGEVVGRFGPSTKPDAPEVIAAIEGALAG